MVVEEKGGSSENKTGAPPTTNPHAIPSTSRISRSKVGPTDPNRALREEPGGDEGAAGDSPDHSEEVAAAERQASESKGRGKDLSPDFFSDFDVEKADPAELKTKFKELSSQYSSLLDGMPARDQLDQLMVKSQAWDRLTTSPEFQRFVASLEGDSGGEGGEGEEVDISSIEGLDDLSDETKGALQKVIDQVVEARVRPLQEAYHSDRAKARLDSLAETYGEDWKRLSANGAIVKEMKTKGVDAETAFLAVRARELYEEKAAAAKADAQRKVRATSEGDASLHGIAAAKGPAKSILEAAEQAEQAFDVRRTG